MWPKMVRALSVSLIESGFFNGADYSCLPVRAYVRAFVWAFVRVSVLSFVWAFRVSVRAYSLPRSVKLGQAG